jgi:outer membrane immunogenic protein
MVARELRLLKAGAMFRKIISSSVLLAALSGTALAADLPSRAPPPVYVPPPPIFTWTGFYVGLEAGDQFGRSSTGIVTGAGAQPSYFPNGFVGGGFAGYNYQISQFVVGVEGNVDGSTYRGSGVDTVTGAVRSTREDVDGSIRGRVGYAWNRILIFGTGGAAIASIRNTTTLGGAIDQFDTTRVGWTAGGGLEYAIDNNWAIRGEYLYSDYGHITEFEATTTGDTINKHETDNKVMLGVSYKFGPPAPPPPPVIAKY